METQPIRIGETVIVETVPGSGFMQSEADALDLVAACSEHGAERLLLHAENLSDAFFDLKSGLAGAALLKFSNYWLRVAAVIPAGRIGHGRFAEFAAETNTGRQFRIFNQRQAALDWLASA
ncbi:MAG: DUF4180 domain-containing protein [Chloroflexota bacterium]|jgi:hypothetical protein